MALRISDCRSVLIVEEYVPEYREPFFESLHTALAAESVQLKVAVGEGSTPLGARGDRAREMPFLERVSSRSISVGGRRLTLRDISGAARNTDLVVADQALRHVENYLLLARQRRGPKVGLWGHGERQAKSATRLERYVERRVTRSAHWFFAYTHRSADRVASAGFPREHITVVHNTIDVQALARLRDAVSPDGLRRTREQLDLPEQHVCLYLGALDPSKRIDFLLDAGSLLATRLPGFTLVIAGDGPERPRVEAARDSYRWLRYAGRAVGSDKATLGAASDLLLVPGGVGLVAVDSFALRTPIVTTAWPYHGPEVDYLENGVNAVVTSDDVAVFAATVERLLVERDALERLQARCAASVPEHTLESMVLSFTRGVVAAIETPLRPS